MKLHRKTWAKGHEVRQDKQCGARHPRPPVAVFTFGIVKYELPPGE